MEDAVFSCHSDKLRFHLCIFISLFTIQSRGEVSVLEQFRAFVASPPIVEKLTFERELGTPAISAPPSNGVAFAKSAYEAAWQPNAYHLIQLGRTAEPITLSEKRLPQSGIFNGVYWNLSDRACTLYYQIPDGVKQQFLRCGGKSPDEYLILEVLHLGIME